MKKNNLTGMKVLYMENKFLRLKCKNITPELLNGINERKGFFQIDQDDYGYEQINYYDENNLKLRKIDLNDDDQVIEY